MLPAVTITLLEKAATENGFDLQLDPAANWFAFGSSQTSMDVWLTCVEESQFVAALSRADVLDGLTGLGSASTEALPSAASGAH